MDIDTEGTVYETYDTFRLGQPKRDLTSLESSLIVLIKQNACSLRDVIMGLPASRERSKALTELEDSVMWAVKGVTA